VDETLAPRTFAAKGSSGVMRVAHLVPVRLGAQDIFSRGVAVLALTPVAPPDAPPVELVRTLFDLTPAEARVARGLAGGKTVEELARDFGVAEPTLRAQVRALLQKTGRTRQTDVVALLSGLSLAREAGGDDVGD
jgi:DNA-binding CsgD family transcriptional regulator